MAEEKHLDVDPMRGHLKNHELYNMFNWYDYVALALALPFIIMYALVLFPFKSHGDE